MLGVATDFSKNEVLDTLVDHLDREELFDFVVELGRRVGDRDFFEKLRDHFSVEADAARGIEVGDVVVVNPGHFFGGVQGVVRGFRGERVVVELAYPGEPPFNLVILPEKLSRVRRGS